LASPKWWENDGEEDCFLASPKWWDGCLDSPKLVKLFFLLSVCLSPNMGPSGPPLLGLPLGAAWPLFAKLEKGWGGGGLKAGPGGQPNTVPSPMHCAPRLTLTGTGATGCGTVGRLEGFKNCPYRETLSLGLVNITRALSELIDTLLQTDESADYRNWEKNYFPFRKLGSIRAPYLTLETSWGWAVPNSGPILYWLGN
jgi:hypothetical protein